MSLDVIVEEGGIIEVGDEHMSVFADENAFRRQGGMDNA